MKILFIIFHGFEPNNGISKKISYQVEAFKENGYETHLCYMDETVSKRRIVDKQIIADYGTGIKGKFLKRTEFGSIIDYATKIKIDFVYIRSNHNASPFTINMVKQMKKAGMKIVMEIPTYPYDKEYFNNSMQKQIIQDKLFRNKLAKQLDSIVTFSEEDFIFGQKTIKISNGIDFESVRLKKDSNHASNELHLIGVAEIHRWHGFDRVIQGLANYYSSAKELKVYFHIVGYFFSPIEKEEITRLISDNHLEPYIILHGKKHNDELDEIFDQCDLGIGSLGRHRVGIDDIKTLKNREYAARGIPFVYSETDTDFDDQPYVLKLPANENAVCIEDLIKFYYSLTINSQQIRNSIEHLSWKRQMRRVIDAIYPLYKETKKFRLAYCIPSLNNSGGMERVLTTKANYLADKLNYDIHIIITDNKGTKPFFRLSKKITVVQLNVNIDNLWQYPLWKRLYLYNKKMRDYRHKLDICLKQLKPDITISLLRREINFLNDIKDGSVKIGEIHFGRYKYREVNFNFVPGFINKWITKIWMKQLEKKIKMLNRFIVLTHEDATYWKGFNNMMVIPNPITIENSLHSDCNYKQAIAVGRYTYQKGFDLLISAWKDVYKKHPDWHLSIFGSGNRKAYANQVKEAGLENIVYCNGPIENVAREYIKSSIFILSSRFEGLPLVLIEAMSTGIPPVAFACPCGPKDIIKNEENGLLCKNGDIHELASQICFLIENEQYRIAMGRNAANSSKQYRLENIMHKWDNLFQNIVRNQPK